MLENIKGSGMFMTEIGGMEIKEILEFPPAPGFGRFKTFFDSSSVAHPAKMHVELCAELIRRYTKPGDVVLDPMNGVGTTTILCMLLGRNAIGVELEEKFHNWCESSRKITEEKIKEFLGALKKRPPVTGWCECNLTEDSYEPTMDVKNPDEVIEKFPIKIETCEKCGKPIYPRFGKVVHICGDARKLNTILKEHEEEISHILFSPPYSLGHDSGDNASERYRWRLDEQRKHTRAYSEGNNIAKLPHSEVDNIIFSPPFGQAQRGGGIAQKGYNGQYGRDERLHLRHDRPLSDREDNISNLPYGADCVITSPPYSETLNEKKNTTSNLRREERLRTAGHQPKDFMGGIARNCQLEDGMRYSFNPKNIGNLKHGEIDTILTSPPYESSLEGTCYDDATEILTRDGWKSIDTISEDDEIASLNPEAYNIEYLRPLCCIKQPYHGEMIRIKNKMIDLLVTPNHNIFVALEEHGKANGQPKLIKVIDALNNGTRKLRFKRTANWNGKFVDYFDLSIISNKNLTLNGEKILAVLSDGKSHSIREISNKTCISPQKIWKHLQKFVKSGRVKRVEVPNDKPGRWNKLVLYSLNNEKNSLPIPMREWLRFFGLYIAEGSATPYKYEVKISNTNLQLLEEIQSYLKKWGFNAFYNSERVVVRNKSLFKYLNQFGHSYKKYIPKDIKELAPELLREFLIYYLRGDGYFDKTHIRAFTSSKQLADDLQEIALKIGWSANIYKRKKQCSSIDGRKITQKHDAYIISFIRFDKGKNGHNSPSIRIDEVKMIDYSGIVWCVELPKNHIIYVRRNGKPVWCGNSRHTKGGIASRDKKLAQTGSLTTLSEDTKKGVPVQYSPNPMNIGNLRKETYLDAMWKVYAECFKVLKPHGKMIIVVKPFVRNFKVVKLHEHTIKLCELAGFVLKEVLLFKLPQKSFWRILYQKKYGSKVKDLNLLDYEWVLVFEKT